MASRIDNNQNRIGDLTGLQTENRTVGQTNTSSTSSSLRQASYGSLPLESEQAKRAIETSVNYLMGSTARTMGIAAANRELAARTVEADELGMMHVRMDRIYNGVKVYGEQVVTHLGNDGQVKNVSGQERESLVPMTFSTRPSITSDDALEIAKKSFVGSPTETPKSELVIYPDSNGNYRLAYHVQLTNLSGNEPSKMNYFLDAKTGQMIDHFNALPIFCPHCKAMMLANSSNTQASSSTTGNTGVVPSSVVNRPATNTGISRTGNRVAASPSISGDSTPRTRMMPGGNIPTRQTGTGSLMGRLPKAAPALTASGSATPNAPIRDNQTTTSTINVNDDLSITGVKVNLNISHTYRGDLVVKLRSPEGREVTLHNKTGGSADNLVLQANPADFNGTSSKGSWQLIVQDTSAQDQGTLNSWSLEVDGTPKNPPPPPPSNGAVTKTATPNTPIRDNQTITSAINFTETGEAGKVKVNVDIAHTYRGDLVVKLQSPSGKEVTLHNKTGGSADNLQFEVERSEFGGEPITGNWKLLVQDTATQDEGVLKSWGLSITRRGDNPPPPPPPTGGGRGSSLYSGEVPLGTTRNADGTYSLTDTTRGNSRTLDAQNRNSGPGVAITDNNNVWGEASDPARNRVAIDAHYGMQLTWDFYKNVLGRSSIDGNGAALISNVHVQRNYNNAFWDGQQMSYGDGDGQTFSPLASIDVAGHEITHGLTERTAGLIYRGESGGLNEAMSDIMGTAIEWYAAQQNPSVQFDWKIGEDIFTPGQEGDALRYMDDPTKDNYSIDHYSNYPRQTEVHGSSGIANNAFYLLVNGGTNRTSGISVAGGIGMEKGAKIFYRALSFYMTPNTNFAGAREATIKAATDLFGANSTEVQKVKESWTAVGVN
ncbi:MAG: M4 family metallopeptidase [Blastocatellia bacterium]|nr:M4 family metallopeptidase [Blastocatellia bacterium]